jgi:hypothetical protein
MFHNSGLLSIGYGSRLWAALVCLLCPFAVTIAAAQEQVYIPYSGIISGTAGAEPVELFVENDTGTVMACTVALAHWYSDNLGQAAPLSTLTVTLWHDPETGVINLLNATNDRMPVEAIWCGSAENMSRTRTRLALPFAIGPAPVRLDRSCAQGSEARLVCSATES